MNYDNIEKIEFESVCTSFKRFAKKFPERIAVYSTAEQLTYSELDKLSNKVANNLIEKGLGKDDIVMIIMPRIASAYSANLGALKSGASYTMVAEDYPDERLSFIYKDAACKAVIATKEFTEKRPDLMKAFGSNVLVYEELAASKNDSSPDAVIDTIKPNDLCYNIYTSGSTGNPKGVMIEHGSLANFLAHTEKSTEIMTIVNNCSVYLAVAPFTFDFSVQEEYIPLSSGGTIALATDEEIHNPLLIKTLMINSKADCIMATPSIISMLSSVSQMAEALKQIKVYDISAEAFPSDLYKKLKAINPDTIIMNAYGATETTVGATSKILKSENDKLTIGKPNANYLVHIIDEDNKEVPDGEIGELLIAGIPAARGYIGLPEKTAECFINFNGMRAYKTGDLCRIDENGELEYHGRRDNQVKYHGYRIELGEIEENIGKHPKIRRSCAAIVEKKLCYYYVLQDNVECEPSEIKEFAKEHLAHYMVPDLYIRLDEMPLTKHQKIDRKKLPSPVIEAEQIVEPVTQIQKDLCDLLEDQLETKIGITTNLFDAGMSSVDSIYCITIIGDKYRIKCSIQDLVNNPTVEELEKFIESAEKIKSFEIKERYPAVDFGAGFYDYWQVCDDMLLTLPCIVKLDADIDVEKLVDCTKKILMIHPAMFETYARQDGEIWQIYHEPNESKIKIEIIDVTEKEFEKEKEIFNTTVIRASEYPLFVFKIYRTPENIYYAVKFSHMISDSESVFLFIEKVLSCYAGNHVAPEQLNVFTLGDELAEFKRSPRFNDVISYHKELLKNVGEYSKVPCNCNGGELKKGYLRTEFDVDKKVLNQKCKKLELSLNTLFCGLYGIALARILESKKSAFLSVYNGRSDSRMKDTIGFLAGTFTVVCDGEKETSLKNFFTSLQAQMIETISQPLAPSDYLMKHYKNFLEIAFHYQPFDSSIVEFGNQKGEYLYLEEDNFSAATPSVTYIYNDDPEKFYMICSYHADKISSETVEKISNMINSMVTKFVSDDSDSLQDYFTADYTRDSSHGR